MSLRRWVVVLMGALLAFGGFSVAAVSAQADVCPVQAGQYPPGQCTAGVSASAVFQDGSVTVFGDGFAAGTRVSFRMSGGFFLGTAVADSAGRAQLTVHIPEAAAVGRHTITLFGGGTVLTTSLQVLSDENGEVVTSGNTSATVSGTSAGSSSSTSSGGLATTGAANLVPLAGGGAALVAIGALTLFVVRRRRSDSVAT